MIRRIVIVLAFISGGPVAQSARPGDTVVLDASAFFEHMPKGTILASPRTAGFPQGAWLYNNIALTMRSQAYLFAKTEIPSDGRYHLFVRSHGTKDTSFRIYVGDQQTSSVFGNEPLTWKKGGTFDLKVGTVDVVLSRVVLGRTGGSTFNALVLTKDAFFTEDKLRALELPEDVALLKEYTIPPSSAVKFGDVDGDGKSDYFVLSRNYDGRMYNHDGKELWSYENEAEGSRGRGGFEAPGLLWDFDGDGKSEAVSYRLTGGKEWLTVADGLTGAIRQQVEWPTIAMPHEYNNFRLAAARLAPGWPSHLLVFTDSGGTISITAYTRELRKLWQHVEEKKKDHLGHYVYGVDLDNDGIDEVVASILALDAKGKVLWNRYDVLDDNHDHCDSFRFADLDGDGLVELLAPTSEEGVTVWRGKDGALLWRRPAEHTQQLEVGNFLSGVPGLHIAANARTYARSGEAGLAGQVHWFDAKGKLLSKWPANPLNGNPDFVKGDWKGDGKQELFWYRFHLGGDGKGSLYFKLDAYHMFDFLGIGSDQVIARGGNVMQIYGHKYATPKKVQRDAEYLRKVANHTHY